MKYRKGSKVEVLNTMDPTSPESWRPAEIVSGNGHTYRVMYDGVLPDSLIARVPRKDLRPYPSLVMGLKTWHEGDHVEVFEGNSWKPGVVAGKDGSYFSVTILGCSMEIKAHGCDVRVRQTWQDGRWIITDKVDLNSDVQIIDDSSKLRGTKKQIKRSEQTSRKMIAIGDYGRVKRRKAKAPYPIPEKMMQSNDYNVLIVFGFIHPVLTATGFVAELPVELMTFKLSDAKSPQEELLISSCQMPSPLKRNTFKLSDAKSPQEELLNWRQNFTRASCNGRKWSRIIVSCTW